MRRRLLDPALLGMGAHVAGARVRRALRGHPRHGGAAEAILHAGLERCWSGEYLTASPGHYRQFWTRDTGFAAPALVRLGGDWPGRLLATIGWAIDVWRDRGSHVSTTINPLLRRPVDIFDYGVDSLPLLLASLRSLTRAEEPAITGRASDLAEEHRAWIEAEVRWFAEHVVDTETGLVRSDRTFSAHRDTFRNSSTAYANTMVALLAKVVAETGWGPDVLSQHFREDKRLLGPSPRRGGAADRAPDWGALLRRHFWTGDRFRDRLGTDDTSGEANVWPFFADIVGDATMQATALQTLRGEGYATPYPLRFDVVHRAAELVPAFRLWSADYQTTTSWTSLGSIYLSLLGEVETAAAAIALESMRELIQRDGTLWEVIDGEGRPWRSRTGLSVSDHSMLWGAILLATMEQPDAPPLRVG